MVSRKLKQTSLLSSLLLVLCLFSLSPSTCQTQAYRFSEHPEKHAALIEKLNSKYVHPPIKFPHLLGSSDDNSTSNDTSSNDTSCPHQEFNASLKASISQEKFTQFKDVYFDFILESVLETNMTYLDFGSNMGFMKDNLFNLTSRGEDAVFELVPADNAFTVRATGIKVYLTSEYTRVR